MFLSLFFLYININLSQKSEFAGAEFSAAWGATHPMRGANSWFGHGLLCGVHGTWRGTQTRGPVCMLFADFVED
jgi:hypothetical protein